MKRKAEICNEIGLYDEMIPAAQRMLELLDDYEQHPSEYHDGSVREPDNDDRPDYIDFYRGKAYAYLATGYSRIESTDARQKAREYLALYEQTIAGQSVTGRFLITSTLRKLEEYDRVLSIYDEVEQQMEIERHAIRERMHIRVILVLCFMLTIVILFAIFTLYQKRQLAKKNAAMVKLIDEKDEQSQLLSNSVEDTGEDLALFRQMDHRIRSERLYADQGIQRDEIAEVLGMKRETINQLLNKYAGGNSIPAYLNEIRLSEACKLLREQPDVTISVVADQVGLTLRNLQRLFREHYGMSPSEYRYSHK